MAVHLFHPTFSFNIITDSAVTINGPTANMKKADLINLAVKYGAPQKDINENQKNNQNLVDLIYRRIAINYGALNKDLTNKKGEELIKFVHTLQPVIDCKRSSCFFKGGKGGNGIVVVRYRT